MLDNKKRCENCEHYMIVEDGSLNMDHEEELRATEDDLGIQIMFDDHGELKEPYDKYEYVDCTLGLLDDESDFFIDKALHCEEYGRSPPRKNIRKIIVRSQR